MKYDHLKFFGMVVLALIICTFVAVVFVMWCSLMVTTKPTWLAFVAGIGSPLLVGLAFALLRDLLER